MVSSTSECLICHCGAVSSSLSGRYRRIPNRVVNDFAVWRQADGRGLLYSTSNGYWKFTWSEETMTTGHGYIRSSEPHEGRAPQDVQPGSWTSFGATDSSISVEFLPLVLTLHVGKAMPDNHVDVVCTNMG